MIGAWGVARRELASYFRAPAGWIILALMMVLTGTVFALAVLVPGRPATMRAFFEASGWLLLPLAPAISMRLFAEELRTGTVEPLLTTPLSTRGLVLGKYLGAMLFLIATLAPTLALPALLFALSEPAPDFGPIVSGYACLLLLGMLYVAIGLLASACTSNATLAFLVTLFAILALLLVGGGAQAAWLPGWARALANALSTRWRVGDFARGVIDSVHVVYFVSLSAAVLAAAAAVVRMRRSA